MGKVNFSCKLCDGNHLIHLCPYMDEASKFLGNLTVSQPQSPTSYHKLSPNTPLVDEVIDQNPPLVNPTLSDSESHKFITNQPLVERMVDSIPPSVDCTFPIESESHTTQVLLVSSGSNELGENPSIPMAQGHNPPFPTTHGGNPSTSTM